MNPQNMMLMLLLADRLGADKPAAAAPAATTATPPAPLPEKNHLLNAVLLASVPRAFAPIAALVVSRNAEAADTAEAKAVAAELATFEVNEARLATHTQPVPALKRVLSRAVPKA